MDYQGITILCLSLFSDNREGSGEADFTSSGIGVC